MNVQFFAKNAKMGKTHRLRTAEVGKTHALPERTVSARFATDKRIVVYAGQLSAYWLNRDFSTGFRVGTLGVAVAQQTDHEPVIRWMNWRLNACLICNRSGSSKCIDQRPVRC